MHAYIYICTLFLLLLSFIGMMRESAAATAAAFMARTADPCCGLDSTPRSSTFPGHVLLYHSDDDADSAAGDAADFLHQTIFAHVDPSIARNLQLTATTTTTTILPKEDGIAETTKTIQMHPQTGALVCCDFDAAAAPKDASSLSVQDLIPLALYCDNVVFGPHNCDHDQAVTAAAAAAAMKSDDEAAPLAAAAADVADVDDADDADEVKKETKECCAKDDVDTKRLRALSLESSCCYQRMMHNVRHDPRIRLVQQALKDDSRLHLHSRCRVGVAASWVFIATLLGLNDLESAIREATGYTAARAPLLKVMLEEFQTQQQQKEEVQQQEMEEDNNCLLESSDFTAPILLLLLLPTGLNLRNLLWHGFVPTLPRPWLALVIVLVHRVRAMMTTCDSTSPSATSTLSAAAPVAAAPPSLTRSTLDQLPETLQNLAEAPPCMQCMVQAGRQLLSQSSAEMLLSLSSSSSICWRDIIHGWLPNRHAELWNLQWIGSKLPQFLIVMTRNKPSPLVISFP